MLFHKTVQVNIGLNIIMQHTRFYVYFAEIYYELSAVINVKSNVYFTKKYMYYIRHTIYIHCELQNLIRFHVCVLCGI